MSSLPVIISALVPIVFVILLGILAGRTGIVKPASSGVLASLVIDFCLPALLFNAIVTAPTAELQDGKFFLGIALGLLGIYLLALVISLVIFRKPINASSLQALNSSWPNMAYLGIPLLISVIGTSAVLSAVVGNLVSIFLLLPLTLTFLEAGSPTQEKRKRGAVVWSSITSAVRKPLVWGPLAGVVMAVAHVPLPVVAQKSLTLIGQATSGVALFAMGLVLSEQKLRIGNAAVSLNVVLKNLAQPAAMWLLAVLLGVTGPHRREMILLGAMPSAITSALIAVQYKVYTEESTTTILLSTVLSIVTLGGVIALTR